MIAYWEAGQQRLAEQLNAELDRLVFGVNWGVAIAHDHTGKNANKWQRLRSRQGRGRSALSGKELESAVMAIAAVDPSLVKITPAESDSGVGIGAQ